MESEAWMLYTLCFLQSTLFLSFLALLSNRYTFYPAQIFLVFTYPIIDNHIYIPSRIVCTKYSISIFLDIFKKGDGTAKTSMSLPVKSSGTATLTFFSMVKQLLWKVSFFTVLAIKLYQMHTLWNLK